MAAVFPTRTDRPWTFNGVTYQYDATEDRWFVISTNKTDLVDESLETLTRGLDVTNTVIDQEIENRSSLLDAAATKNNQQDSSIIGLEARVDALASSVGSLQFKGRYTYVIESSEDACNAALAEAIAGGMNNAEALRIHGECVAAVGQPYDAGSFTSKGATNVIDEIEEFLITTNDLDGHTIDWLNVTEEGDYLEFFDIADGDTALYEVVDEPTISSTEQTIRVKFISETGEGDQKFNLQSEYEVRVFKAAQGIDLEEANLRYVAKPYVVYFEDTPSDITPVHPSGDFRNGELWFDTSSLELFVWNNNAWVASAKPPSQDIVVQNVVADVDELQNVTQETVVRVNSLISDLMLEPNIYYSDTTPTGDITGTLRNGDLWIDGTNLEVKFYSGGVWVNPDRQIGGDYLEKSGGEMTGKLTLKRPRTDSAGNNLVVWGRINGVEGILLKDYQRKNSSASNDYIVYYGGSDNNDTIMNRGYADGRYLLQSTATANYLTKSDAINTYLAKSDATTKYLQKSDASSTYLRNVDADGTYLKISDYVPGGGTVGGLPLTGGVVSGTISSNTAGGGTSSAFRIQNTDNSVLAWLIWCPGGAGEATKYVGRFGTAHWFQNYDDADGDVKTTAKFNYGSYEFRATNSLMYSATDAHYFKGQVRFSSGSGELKLSQTPSNLDVYTTARFTTGIVVKATGEAIGGNNSFSAFPDHTTYVGRQTADTDIVNKKYIDDKIAALEARIVALGG